jgi:hypothetical protein
MGSLYTLRYSEGDRNRGVWGSRKEYEVCKNVLTVRVIVVTVKQG